MTDVPLCIPTSKESYSPVRVRPGPVAAETATELSAINFPLESHAPVPWRRRDGRGQTLDQQRGQFAFAQWEHVIERALGRQAFDFRMPAAWGRPGSSARLLTPGGALSAAGSASVCPRSRRCLRPAISAVVTAPVVAQRSSTGCTCQGGHSSQGSVRRAPQGQRGAVGMSSEVSTSHRQISGPRGRPRGNSAPTRYASCRRASRNLSRTSWPCLLQRVDDARCWAKPGNLAAVARGECRRPQARAHEGGPCSKALHARAREGRRTYAPSNGRYSKPCCVSPTRLMLTTFRSMSAAITPRPATV